MIEILLYLAALSRISTLRYVSSSTSPAAEEGPDM